jgi:hypothetical protein
MRALSVFDKLEDLKMTRAKRVVKELDHVMLKGIAVRRGMSLKAELGAELIVADIKEDAHGAYLISATWAGGGSTWFRLKPGTG